MYHINPLPSFSLLASILNLSFPQLILNFHVLFGNSLTLFRVTYISSNLCYGAIDWSMGKTYQ